MAFGGSESRGQANESNDDDDNRIGVAEVEVAATHFRQKKKDADGYNDNRTHKAANGATLARATNTITHRCFPSRGRLLRLAVHPVAEHQNANSDQNQGPEPSYAVPVKPFKIIEQEQEANPNQDDGADRPALAEIIEGVW